MKENGVVIPNRQFNITVRYRFPKYLRTLRRAIQQGISIVNTDGIASEVGEKGTNVKQDFFFCSFKGRQKVGYKSKYLYQSIINKLGFNKERSAFIVGISPVNEMLLNHPELKEYGLRIKGVYDIKPDNIGKQIGEFLVQDYSLIPDNLELAIITTEAPWRQMQDLLDFIISKNIKVIWNFSTHLFQTPENIMVIDTDIIPAYAAIAQNLDMVEKGMAVETRQFYY